MTEEIKKKHPTNILVEEINKFTRDVEALRIALPVIMEVMGNQRQEAAEKFNNFLDDHGTLMESDESNLHYTFPIEHAGLVTDLKKQYESFLTTCPLVPRQFIISLISQYDNFLGQVIRFIFSVKPEVLNASEKAITYADWTPFSPIRFLFTEQNYFCLVPTP